MGLAGRNAAGAAAGARGGRGAAGPGAPRSEAISEGAQAGAPPLPKVSISRCEAFGAIGGISLRLPKGPGPHPKRTPTQVESSGREGGPHPRPAATPAVPHLRRGSTANAAWGSAHRDPGPRSQRRGRTRGVAPRAAAAAREEPGARTANDGFGNPRSRKFPRARARCAAASRGQPRTPGGCGAGDRRGRGDPSGGGTCSPARRR